LQIAIVIAEQFWNWYGALRRENTWVLELVEVSE